MNKNICFEALKLFEKKGTRFTIEDLARELGTSKRTIYMNYSGKDEVIEKTIDFVFEDIFASDSEILEDEKLSIKDKIMCCLNNIPSAYNLSAIIKHMDDLQRYYPALAQKGNDYIDSLWNNVISVIERGIKDGQLKEIDTVILKLMLNESLKKLLNYEFLSENKVDFEYCLKAMNQIILYGLLKE